MRRNIHNWFLCGLSLAGVLSLAAVTFALARAAVLAGDAFGTVSVFLAATLAGGVCWLFKRDPRPDRRGRAGAAYCFISKERKARIEDVL